MCSMIKCPLYSNPMRHFGETIKYNYISLITHSSASGAVANKAFQCLTISYSLLFISFAFSHLRGIYLAFSVHHSFITCLGLKFHNSLFITRNKIH